MEATVVSSSFNCTCGYRAGVTCGSCPLHPRAGAGLTHSTAAPLANNKATQTDLNISAVARQELA